MSDLEFFFDPVCPWAWITSRWVEEVRVRRDYDVTWRFISLRMINEEIGYGEGSEPWRTAQRALIASPNIGTRMPKAIAFT